MFARTAAGFYGILALLALNGCAGAMSRGTLPPAARDRSSETTFPMPATLTYAGTLEETTVTQGKTTHRLLNAAQQVRALRATFGQRAVTEYRGTETETGKATKLASHFDLYAAQIASRIRKGSDVTLLDANAEDSTGTAAMILFRSGNGTFDELPEVPEARWQDTAARVKSLTDASESTRDVYSADGSYRGMVSFSSNEARASLQSYADGHAVYQWPYQNPSQDSNITFSPPKHGQLRIEFTNASDGFPTTTVFQIRAWYPSVRPLLGRDSFQNLGSVQVPAYCHLPKGVPTHGTELVERRYALDIVFGTYETLQRHLYVAAPYGLICSNVRAQLATHYDYGALDFSTTPLVTITENEILRLKQAHIPKGDRIAQTDVVLSLDAQVNLLLDRRHLAQERRIFNSLKRLGTMQ